MDPKIRAKLDGPLDIILGGDGREEPKKDSDKDPPPKPKLTPEQLRVWDSIAEEWDGDGGGEIDDD